MRALAFYGSLTLSSLGAVLVAVPLDAEPRVQFASHRAVRKEAASRLSASASASASGALLGTLVQVHTNEHVALAEDEPSRARFDDLLADRTTGERHALDPRLLDLLRSVAGKFPSARIELVSGFRSPKLNERLRKKGHNVASHSQHSLGHAVDFRVVPGDVDDAEPVEPAKLELLVRQLGWAGGVGIYPGRDDRFVHCDVGPKRRWLGH